MKLTPYALLTLISISVTLTIHAQQKKPSAGKAPAWVTFNTYNYNTSSLENEAEDGYMDLLLERQVSVAEQTIFIRKALKILTESGIQNASEISVSFDPQYQSLTFHSIQLIRDHKVINKLDLSKIKTIHQEEDLKRFIYNGSLSSVLFLEDVRKEDIVEYSYTIKGVNPVFNDKFSMSFPTQFIVPIAHIYYKLIVPKQRTLEFKNNNTNIQPAISEAAGTTVYEWKINDVKPLHLEDHTPSWCDPFGEVMVSEYKSWKEVNDWAMKLFPGVKNISPALRKKIEQINTTSANDEEKILASLHFVQDDVRYMGIEMGRNSHKPQHPDKIFAQRFGDCKDKSYLLCTILRQMNIEASPVLINTDYKKAIKGWLPSPKNFDHTTVRVKYNNKYYWFDATASLQRGGINNISYPDYQYGLVISDSTDALTNINVKEPGMITAKEIFDIPDMSGNAKLKVITHYSGSFADNMRGDFNANSSYEMQKSFKDFYASYYKDIAIDSLSYSDKDSTGIFTTTEYYSIKNLWEKEGKKKKVFFDPYLINSIITRPKETKRTMPFYLSYPAKYKETVEINVPEEWSGIQSSEKIKTTYLLFKAKFSYSNRKFILDYEYENLLDHVAPEKTNEFLAEMKRKDDNFSYQLSLNPDAVDSSTLFAGDKPQNNYNFFRPVLVFLVIGAVTWWRARRNRS